MTPDAIAELALDSYRRRSKWSGAVRSVLGRENVTVDRFRESVVIRDGERVLASYTYVWDGPRLRFVEDTLMDGVDAD